AVQARIEQRLEALRAAEAAQREIAASHQLLNGLDKRFGALKFDFKLVKGLPLNKDTRFLVRVRPARPVVAPKLTACDLRRALTGGSNTETRQKEARLRVIESAAASSENSEL
ncbi:MAG TPA: hypothetical protein VF747_09065, partial [Blastocatellia bacterium]